MKLNNNLVKARKWAKENNVRWWWLSSSRMTFLVAHDEDGIIVTSAPIATKFKGQHIRNLVNWMKKQGGFEYEEMEVT